MDSRLAATLIVAIIATAVVLLVRARSRTSDRLRQRFGPEYERTVRESGPAKAAVILQERARRVKHFRLHRLGDDEQSRFRARWSAIQGHFVDNPGAALEQADRLVDQAVIARGYPQTPFKQRAEDISVEHAGMADNYRVAHQVTVRRREGQVATEDLRNALLHYRSLFEDLLRADQMVQSRRVA